RARIQKRYGNRVFQVRSSPLQNASGEHSGMVLEWKDKTDELEFEESIIRTVEAAINGDLHGRIATGASDGNIAGMANSINQLLDTFTNVIDETAAVLSSLSS